MRLYAERGGRPSNGFSNSLKEATKQAKRVFPTCNMR